MKECDHGSGETIATMDGHCAICGRDLTSKIADVDIPKEDLR